MQQCPYLQEMKERLILQGADPEQLLLVTSTKTIKTTVKAMDKDVLEVHQDPAVGTVVKVSATDSPTALAYIMNIFPSKGV